MLIFFTIFCIIIVKEQDFFVFHTIYKMKDKSYGPRCPRYHDQDIESYNNGTYHNML